MPSLNDILPLCLFAAGFSLLFLSLPCPQWPKKGGFLPWLASFFAWLASFFQMPHRTFKDLSLKPLACQLCMSAWGALLYSLVTWQGRAWWAYLLDVPLGVGGAALIFAAMGRRGGERKIPPEIESEMDVRPQGIVHNDLP